MISDLLKGMIEKALAARALSLQDIHLEHPSGTLHGDYASNVALVLAKERGENPRELAENFVRYIVQNLPEKVEKVEVAEPGFINFYLSRKFFADTLRDILAEGEDWGSNKELSGKKIMVEYTDPNPFKEFHIGHLMPNVIGESISRLIAFSGAEVKRANYQGDVGLHVAKAVWGMQRMGDVSASAEMGKAYALGSKAYEERAESKQEMDALNKKIYARSDAGVTALYDYGRKLSLEHFETLYKRLGTRFDFYFFESETGPIGAKLVRERIGSVFEKSDGAVVFHGEKEGLHTRVFFNSEGLPTYEAKELGLAFLKEERFPTNFSISVTGNEITEYFKVVRAALRAIAPNLAEKLVHIPHGMLRVPSGKMSSRTGDVIAAERLIEEVSKKVREKMSERTVKDKETTVETIAIGAIKYSILKQAIGGDIVFDFEKSVSFEGDSGPYLQYAATRAASVLEKAKTNNQSPAATHPTKDIQSIERLLYRFPEVVLRAAREYAPQYVATYLVELAAAFNHWYAEEKIIDETPESPYKLALTSAFHLTMVNGLALLGIKTPEQM